MTNNIRKTWLILSCASTSGSDYVKVEFSSWMCLKKHSSNLKFPLPFSFAGEVPSVLASRPFSQVPILCGGSNGWVQHASVHSQRVQSHRCQGMSDSLCVCVCLNIIVLVSVSLFVCVCLCMCPSLMHIRPKSFVIPSFHSNAESHAKC